MQIPDPVALPACCRCSGASAESSLPASCRCSGASAESSSAPISPTLRLLLEAAIGDSPTRVDEVAAVFATHELTIELLREMSEYNWEQLRREAQLSIGLIERVKCHVAAEANAPDHPRTPASNQRSGWLTWLGITGSRSVARARGPSGGSPPQKLPGSPPQKVPQFHSAMKLVRGAAASGADSCSGKPNGRPLTGSADRPAVSASPVTAASPSGASYTSPLSGLKTAAMAQIAGRRMSAPVSTGRRGSLLLKREYIKGLTQQIKTMHSDEGASRLVRISPHLDARAASLPITMLIDTKDVALLRLQLFKAAGQPERRVKLALDDRATWTMGNLRELTTQQLVDAQRYAGVGYKSVLRLPINLLKLAGCANNMTPFSSFLFPTDKFDLTHSNHGRVDFKLDTAVFDSGTTRNSRAALQQLKRELFGAVELEAYNLFSSPVHAVTLPDAARAKAHIPLEARFYAFCYPVDRMEQGAQTPHRCPGGSHGASASEGVSEGAGAAPVELEQLAQHFSTSGKALAKAAQPAGEHEEIDRRDPFVQFLTVGAFLYFNFAYDIVAVNAISYDEAPAEAGTTGILYLAPHSPLPPMAILPLKEKQRWWPVTEPEVLRCGFTHFAFVMPSEFIGDHIFTQSGGFAYLHRDGFETSVYFPVAPKLALVKVARREPDDAGLSIDVADLGETHIDVALQVVEQLCQEKPILPILYDAPLHIEGLRSGENALSSATKFIGETVDNVSFNAGRGAALGVSRVLGYSDENDVLSQFGKYDDSIDAIRNEIERAAKLGLYGASDEDLENMRYVLYQPADNAAIASNDGTGMRSTRDEGHAGLTLRDFAQMREAQHAELTLAEVAALRLYTTSTFRLINGPLRQHVPKHPLAATVLFISRALKKLRALHMGSDDADGDGHVDVFKPRVLWRGLKDLSVSDDFMRNGGCERACLSTSDNLRIIAGYAWSAHPMLFRLRVDSPMEQGADISWLSTFPQEEEVLYPPLTYLKPMFKQRIKGLDAGFVITVKPSFPS